VRERQTYLLDGVENGVTGNVVTLPRQERPLRLIAVYCTFSWGGGTGQPHCIFLRVRHAKVATIINLATGTIADALTGSVTFGIGLNNEIRTFNAATTEYHTIGLPSELIVEPQDVVTLEMEHEAASASGDVIGVPAFEVLR